MKYENKVLEYMDNNADTITIDELKDLDVPKNTLSLLVKNNQIERTKIGLYLLKNSWGDEYFNLLYNDKYAVFSHLTALYLQNLCEKVPIEYDITVRRNYSGSLRKNKNVKLYYVDNETYSIGLMKIKSPQGRVIRCYDIERCLCDLIKYKDKIYIEYLKYAFNEYYKIQKHDTKKLFQYARELNVYDQVVNFMEAFL